MQSIYNILATAVKRTPGLMWQLRSLKRFHKPIKLKGDFYAIPDMLTYVARAALENRSNGHWALMADKFKVRKYIAETIGEEYLIPLLGKWDKPEDIDFDSLKAPYVLKTNNGCGTNVFVHDDTTVDRKAVIAQLNKGLRFPYAELSGQQHYSLIEPCIVAEKFMEQGEGQKALIDYKFHCVNGEPMLIAKFLDRDEIEHFQYHIDMYTPKWQSIPQYTDPMDVENAPEAPGKPEQLDKMLEIARTLSKGEEFVRVDLYLIGGKIYFGELTYTPDTKISHGFDPHEKAIASILKKIKSDRRGI